MREWECENQIEKLKREGKEYGKNRSKKRKERKKD